MRDFSSLVSSCVLLLVMSSAVASELDDGYGDLEDFYGDEDFVSIATGASKAIAKAPAVTTVIDAADIAQMGARDLDEVLEAVPGIHVARSPVMYKPLYVARGVYSGNNAEMLVLINGIPITNLFQGDRNLVWGGMPVRSIARIEVIRGPGSAMYGADAFSGVINIIIKDNVDIDGTEVGVAYGSFNTTDAWLLHGGAWGDFDLALTLELSGTDGQEEIIKEDAFGGSGPVNLGRNNADIRFDLGKGLWRFRAGFQGRYNAEGGLGVNGAIDPDVRSRSERYNADLTYDNPLFSDDWEIKFQSSVFYTSQEVETPWLVAPPMPGFDEGMLGAPEVYERRFRLGLTALYSAFEDHQLRFGVGWEKGEIYRVEEAKNFTGLSPNPEGMVSVSDTDESFLPEKKRKTYYLFAQHEWLFHSDWELTTGLRYDDYSDFGHTLNPRLALVWQMDYDLTSKLLYGRAFRAPAFAELYNRNNPVAEGNLGLEAQTIDTVELAFDYRPVADWWLVLNLFSYQMREVIELVNAQYQNEGRRKGRGFELEGQWDVTTDLAFSGNFAFQRSIDETTGTDVGFAPSRQLYARTHWHFTPRWQLNTQVNWVMDRVRANGDTRKRVSDYALTDLNVVYSVSDNSRWRVALHIRNLFDEKAVEPLAADRKVPNDLPLAGRNYYAEVAVNF